MTRVIEIVVLLNALGGLATFGTRWLVRRHRVPAGQRVAELERENEEIDAAIERMRKR